MTTSLEIKDTYLGFFGKKVAINITKVTINW